MAFALCGVTVTAVNCRKYERPPALSEVSPEELFRSPLVIVGQVNSITWGDLWPNGPTYLRHATLSLSHVIPLTGEAPDDLLVRGYIYESPYSPPFEGQAYNQIQVNQWRLFFLQREGSNYAGIRDGDAFSYETASAYSRGDLTEDESLSERIAKVLLRPARVEIDPDLPHRVGQISDRLVIPLVGRARGLELLEGLLESPNSALRTRACEYILYLTDLPHQCLDRLQRPTSAFFIERDNRMQTSLRSFANRFGKIRTPQQARLVVETHCRMDEPSVALVSWISKERDCERFVELAARHVARGWSP